MDKQGSCVYTKSEASVAENLFYLPMDQVLYCVIAKKKKKEVTQQNTDFDRYGLGGTRNPEVKDGSPPSASQHVHSNTPGLNTGVFTTGCSIDGSCSSVFSVDCMSSKW